MEQNIQLTSDQLLELLKKVDDYEVFIPFGAGSMVRECESA